MKTDAIFYEIFKEFPNIFFEIIGKSETNINIYEFAAPEIKQTSFTLELGWLVHGYPPTT
jgi:predicted transposase YdaD